jgi:hypothetical protein
MPRIVRSRGGLMTLDEPEPSAPMQLVHATATALRDGWSAALLCGAALSFMGVAVAWQTLYELGWLREPLELYRASWIEHLIEEKPLIHVCAIPFGTLALLLVVAGPLAAFGRAARGEAPSVRACVLLGLLGALRALPIHAFLALSILIPQLVFDAHTGPGLGLFLLTVLPAFFLFLLAPYFAVRFFALATVALIVDPGPSWLEATLRAVRLGRGQLALFSFAWLAPIALFLGALLGPAEQAKSLLYDAVGQTAGEPLVELATVLAAVVAVWLGCAIQAASYAVASRRSAR